MTARSRWAGYWFVAPYGVIFLVFLVWPLLNGFYLSLQSYDLLAIDPPKFVGFANYDEALHDEYFWKALRATLTFVVLAVPLTTGVALGLAVAVDSVKSWRANIYRLGIFLPGMLTVTVVALIWRWFLNNEFGLFNEMLKHLGLRVEFLTHPWPAMLSIVAMTVWWGVGGPTMILLAGLRQIPQQLYEAGAIDGATGRRAFVSITLPMLRPVLLFVLVINAIGAFQVFGQTFLVTAGGPENSTRVLVHYIYEVAFRTYRLGYGSAISWLLFAVIAVFAVLQFRVFREK